MDLQETSWFNNLLETYRVGISSRLGVKDDWEWLRWKDNATAWTITIYSDSNGSHRVMETPFFMGAGHRGKPPEIEEVLWCLFTDIAMAYDSYKDEYTFKAFARQMRDIGCDKDASEIYDLYEKIMEDKYNLIGVIGLDMFDKLMDKYITGEWQF